MWANLINSLLPYNSFGVVPDFPWRARITACVASTVQEAGIEPESASFVVSFPFGGVSVGQLPPNQSDLTAVLLPPAAKTALSGSSVIVITIGFQWYKVPLFRYSIVVHWSRHLRSSVFKAASGRLKWPVCVGKNGSGGLVDAGF